ncbi:CheR family methyltransferase [Flavobacterium sp.]|uniref:CheR family methyltransferase n=1 Tax=Flavobacterium sp. TaxID=239 RepID=UPI002EDA9A53
MKTNETIVAPHNTHFQVTAIGSSGAEIDILRNIVSNLALDSGRAYIIFENLSSPQTHNLADELKPYTQIPVIEIVHHVDIQPNQIYIIPENNFLILEDGILKLESKNRISKADNSFDLFFEAVGQTYKAYSIGVILTWFPLDGSTGLKKLKEAGGSTIAALSKRGLIQNEITSEYIDYFTAPHEIASKLLQIHESNVITHSYEEKEESTPSEKQLLDQIIEILLLKKGTDFQHYKHSTLRRRIAKRMVDTKQETVEKYVDLLRNNSKEQDLLFDDFLISVSYFFRDQEAFNNLCKTVIPFLIENLTNNTIRIWSAGCATGEEAYSLAICIHEYLEEIERNDIKVQIIASDLSEKCISKARSAIYTVQDVKNISDKRLAKYFTKRDNSFHINKIIRDMCVFAVHDLTKDAPFAKIDFVSCRNVLIYFDTHLQNQVLASFHYALRLNGYLFLGKSEWAHHVPHLFTAVDKLDRIYTRNTIASLQSKKISHNNQYKNLKIAEDIEAKNDYSKITSDILLEHFSAAAVLINEDLEIIHFHGDTSPFLRLASGKPSFSILSMARDELVFQLRNYILRAKNEKKSFSGEFISSKRQPFLNSFEIIYLPSHPELLLIIFYQNSISSSDSMDV